MEKNRLSKNKQYSFKNSYIKYTTIGFQMLATIVIGVLLGKFIDTKAGTYPIFTAVCSLLFVVASMYIALKDFIKK